MGRARATVLSGLAAFAVLWVGAAVVVEGRRPEVIDPSYYNRVRCFRQGLAADPAHTRTVVMLGTSRTYDGLRADLLSESLSGGLGRPVSVTNLGIPGGCFLNDLLTWRRLRRDGVRPDLLLVEVMPGLFTADSPIQMTEEWMPSNRLSWFDLGVLEPYRAGTRPDLAREVALVGATTLYSRRYALLRAVTPRLVPACDEDGNPLTYEAGRTGPLPAEVTPAIRAKAMAQAYESYAGWVANCHPERCESVREVLADAREAGIPVALVVMPEGPVYRSWYGPETWPRVQTWIDQVSQEYGAEVINAREWIDEEEDFIDSHHLLPEGAARFSERLGREHLLPLLRRLPEPGS